MLYDMDLELLDDEYINSTTPMKYKCSCGNTAWGRLNDLNNGHRCFECSGRKKFTLDEINEFFSKNNCELLTTEYIGIDQKLEFLCFCNRIGNKTYREYRKFPCCSKCGVESKSGENHPNWNGGISSILVYFRNRLVKWRKESVINSDYKCVITGEAYNVIHHLYGFENILNEAFSNLGIHERELINQYEEYELNVIANEIIRLHDIYPLGVCLTNIIHREFHRLYGYGDNTPDQFYEFYRIKTGLEYPIRKVKQYN
jgi:hypothetical protein